MNNDNRPINSPKKHMYKRLPFKRNIPIKPPSPSSTSIIFILLKLFLSQLSPLLLLLLLLLFLTLIKDLLLKHDTINTRFQKRAHRRRLAL